MPHKTLILSLILTASVLLSSVLLLLFSPVQSVSFLYGDANQDGEITKQDLSLLSQWLLGAETPPETDTSQFKAADLNNNNLLDQSDYNSLFYLTEVDISPASFPILLGDINQDGSITTSDLNYFTDTLLYGDLGAFRGSPIPAKQFLNSDIIPDNKLTQQDADTLQQYLAGEITTLPPAEEPSPGENHAPTVIAGDDQTAVIGETTQASLVGVATDPDPDQTLTTTWAITKAEDNEGQDLDITNPDIVGSIENPAQLETQYTLPPAIEDAAYIQVELTLKAQDDGQPPLSSQDSLLITVFPADRPDIPPIVSVVEVDCDDRSIIDGDATDQPISTTPDQTVCFEAFDASGDDDIQSWEAGFSPEGFGSLSSEPSGDSLLVNYTAPDTQGEITITITATDDQGASGEAQVEVVGGLISKAKNVIVGNSFSCALLDDNTVKCWGEWDENVHKTAVDIGLSDVKKIILGGTPVIALKNDGTVVGYRLEGLPNNVEDITLGSLGLCALLNDGSVVCDYRSQWKEVFPSGSAVKMIGSLNGQPLQVCAILTTGQVSCWREVEPGRGFVVKEIAGIDNPQSISLGYAILNPSLPADYTPFGCALLQDSRIKCWGNNYYGQLGNGNYQDQDVPVEVVGINNAVKVVAGANSACALLNDKTIKCWGKGGTLGGGDGNNHNQPVEVIGIDDVGAIDLSIGLNRSCALLESGQVRCWGFVGCWLSRYSDDKRPFIPYGPVMGVNNAISIDLDDGYSNPNGCVLLSSGRIKCWGYNGHGQLGNGTIFSPTDLTAQEACPDLNRRAGPDYVIGIEGEPSIVDPPDPANIPPTAYIVATPLEVTRVTALDKVSLDGDKFSFDPDNNYPLTVQWTILSPSGFGTIIDSQELKAIYQAPAEVTIDTEVMIELKITDSQGATDVTMTKFMVERSSGPRVKIIEDAEDGDVAGWQNPSYVLNVADPIRPNNRVLQFKAVPYAITHSLEGLEGGILSWDMLFDLEVTNYVFRIDLRAISKEPLKTIEGKTLSYTLVSEGVATPLSISFSADPVGYIHLDDIKQLYTIGIGEETISDQWVSVKRDLQADIKQIAPEAEITYILTDYIWINIPGYIDGYIDNIVMERGESSSVDYIFSPEEQPGFENYVKLEAITDWPGELSYEWRFSDDTYSGKDDYAFACFDPAGDDLPCNGEVAYIVFSTPEAVAEVKLIVTNHDEGGASRSRIRTITYPLIE